MHLRILFRPVNTANQKSNVSPESLYLLILFPTGLSFHVTEGTYDHIIGWPQESEIESKLNKLPRKDEDDKEDKMAQVRAALKEVNQRNRDLGRRVHQSDRLATIPIAWSSES